MGVRAAFCVRLGESRGVGGSRETLKGQNLADCLTKSLMQLKKKKGDVSFPSLWVFMIWVGRESILNVWLIKVCVPLCPTNGLQRGLHPLLQEAYKKKKAISCFTWCGYPISYTKHVVKQMYANMLLFLVDVLSPGEPSQICSKAVWWNIVFGVQ